MRPAGGNHKLFRHWVDEIWRIPANHFDPYRASAGNPHRPPIPLAEVMVESSTYQRGKLKRRLLNDGLLEAECEMCGQGEDWHGARLTLILGHINGVPDDHRLENLRMLCPNCAATLPTHCGRKNAVLDSVRECDWCGAEFVPATEHNRYCCRACSRHAPKKGLIGKPRPSARKVERPPFDQLLAEIKATSWSAVGRKYGVSDNAVRKWVRWYERERERREADAQRADRRDAA